MSEFGQKHGGKCFMRRVLFVFLFALTALSFAGCSSSDDDGGSGGGIPSLADVPSPDSIDADHPQSYSEASRSIRYELSAEARDAYYEELKGDGWNCNRSSSDPNNGNCWAGKTEGGVNYNLNVNFWKNDQGDEIQFEQEISLSSSELPKESLSFEDFFPAAPSGSKINRKGYEVKYDFSDSDKRDDYLDTYISALTAKGFTKYEGYIYLNGTWTAGSFTGLVVEFDEEGNTLEIAVGTLFNAS
jgi:hypothetical protein